MRKYLCIIAMLTIVFVSCDIDMEPTDREIELEDSLNVALDMIYELNSQLEEAKDSASYYKEVIDNIKHEFDMTFYDNEYTLDEFLKYMEEGYYYEL